MSHEQGAEHMKANGAAAVAPEASLDYAAAEAEIDRLSKLSPLAYAKQRSIAAKRIDISQGELDKLVKAKRETGTENGTAGQGRAIDLPDPEPWDQAVDGAALLAEIAAEIARYMVMSDGAAETAALWVVHTHTIEAFGISPRLAITSPRPGCGKTTLLDILAHLVPRPLLMANVSAAAVFRTVEVAHPTLLADEADTWLVGKHADDALRGILNSGHRRGSSVIRVVGDDFEPRQFSTWGACAIAMIGKLPGTLADRSIPIALQRKRTDEVVASFRLDRTERLDVLARKAARWARDNLTRLKGMDPIMPASLSNRAADNWRPPLAIAAAAGGDWPRRAREIAAATVDADQSRRAGLLADIHDIFAVGGEEHIASAELVERLVAMEGHEWAEYRNGKPITVNSLARLLARDGISPGTIWLGNGKSLKGYKREQFVDAWARYLPDPPNQTVRPSESAENLAISGILHPSAPKPSDASESARKPQFSAGPDALTVPNRDSPEIFDEEGAVDWRGEA
jgi:hypothetical protein